jgi:hypothetical protein
MRSLYSIEGWGLRCWEKGMLTRRLSGTLPESQALCIENLTHRIWLVGNESIGNGRRIDEFLPSHDFRAAYDVCINAPARVVYRCLLRADFNDVWLVRLLMSLRSGKWLPRNRIFRDLFQRLKGTGFVVLAEVPNEELVIGVAGRFWRPDGGRCMDLAADDFAGFSRSGFAKAAWNFELLADSLESTVLSTETRIKCFGPAALWKFRLYWCFVGPFSGLIRKAMLKRVKTQAESIVVR